MADYPSDNYALHARLIGSVPRREEDLFLCGLGTRTALRHTLLKHRIRSIFCGLIFLGLAGYGIYQWRMPRTKEKDVSRHLPLSEADGVERADLRIITCGNVSFRSSSRSK